MGSLENPQTDGDTGLAKLWGGWPIEQGGWPIEQGLSVFLQPKVFLSNSLKIQTKA